MWKRLRRTCAIRWCPLTAEVALNYVDVRSYQSQLAITRSNLAAQEESYGLTRARYESGLATELDAEQARLTVESTRAGIPALETSLTKAANNIAVLLGERPGTVDAELATVKPGAGDPGGSGGGASRPTCCAAVPTIRSAERQVAAQTARLGVAKLDLLPTFSLSGTLGLGSSNILNLLTPNGILTNFAGSVQHTVFNRQKIPRTDQRAGTRCSTRI